MKDEKLKTRGRIKVGIVGCGAIGSTLALLVQKRFRRSIAIVALCDIVDARARALGNKIRTARVMDLEKLIRKSDLVIESASGKVSYDVARKTLRAKKDVMIMSVGGVLGKEEGLFSMAIRHKARIFFPSGAICGLDGIRALAHAKIKSITLTTMKPPQGLKGVPYLEAQGISVDALTEDKVVFEGSAQEAVKAFPQNINVVALLSLAACGQVEPRVKIVASPALLKNVHNIEVEADAARLLIRCENEPSPDNPKTSYLAILSAEATIAGILESVKIGN
jgi:aspartate dehydrogenase